MFIRYSRDSVTIRGRSTASSAPGLLYSRIHQHDHQGTPALHAHASLKAHCCTNIAVCVLQNLQTRVTDLQGQISRLSAERLQAQEDAAVARAAKGSHERELQSLENELQNLRSTFSSSAVEAHVVSCCVSCFTQVRVR